MDQKNRQYLAEQTFPSRLDQLSIIGEFIAEAAGRTDMSPRGVFAVQMAVDEAATNIIIHGYGGRAEGPIHIACWLEEGDFAVELRDNGRTFDPERVPEPDLQNPLETRREGGLGIFLMRKMMDRVEFTQEGDENVVTMFRRCVATAGLSADTAVVSPQGRIDATTSPDLEQRLRESMQAGRLFLMVDLAQVTYVSSSGLRVLLVVAKELGQRGGHLVLCCPQPGVTKVLQITGFSEILPLYPSREAALKALEVSSNV